MQLIKHKKKYYAKIGDKVREVSNTSDNVEKLIMSHLLRTIEEKGTPDDFGHYKHNGHKSYRRDSKDNYVKSLESEEISC